MVKLGGLAFGVAQDDKVRELATILHKGARRRGIFSLPSGSGDAANTTGAQTAGKAADSHPIPFAPTTTVAAPAKKSAPSKLPPGIHLPPQVGFPSGTFGKYMNAGNAKKMKQWATEIIGQHLISK